MTEEDWIKKLSQEEFQILRLKGTERPWTGKFLNNKKSGIYICKGCGKELFKSSTKFDSGCGWPSFFEPIKSENVTETSDRTHGMVRTEITCSNCDGHLGHVFDDAPDQPTGLRYCINSVSLDFKEE
ncbi:MAG: peptide-methionine (R)-S-oxide reductase MsrB [Candidatus Heimdallarchaeota archaeon]|nr:peptide-methionine (R)-S-oxide reductase MsrB [Candidatus Heimdallarchaeota archaeon]